MRTSLSLRLAVAGLLLLVAGLLCWATGADLVLHRALRLPRGPWVKAVAALSALGSLAPLAALALLATLWLAVRRRLAEAGWLFASVFLGRIAVELVKDAVQRPRPPLADRLEPVTSWSFPSAHSANTAILALLLAALAGRRPGWPAALATAALIGWTRVALAVHWPGDVLAGWGLGMLWAAAALRLRLAVTGQRRDRSAG